MKTNQEYKNAALEALKGNWAPAVVATIIYAVISLVISFISAGDPTSTSSLLILLGLVWSIFVQLPLNVGIYNAFNALLKDDDDQIFSNMFNFAFGNILRNVGGMLLMIIFVFLWALLLYIPGIIKGLAYSMTPFILKDYPELSANEAINLSMKMMKGHKFDYFCLCLSFIGWMLLGILTLGIGYLWLVPYMYTTTAAFYQDLKNEYVANKTEE